MTRNYPIQCDECGTRTVAPATIKSTIEVRHEGTMHVVRVSKLPVLRCASCGEADHTNDSERAVLRALRDQLGLLQPQEIRERRNALALTQAQLAEALGIAAESISRWENGMLVQARSTDRILRAYFDLPALRMYYSRWTEAAGAPDAVGATGADSASATANSGDWVLDAQWEWADLDSVAATPRPARTTTPARRTASTGKGQSSATAASRWLRPATASKSAAASRTRASEYEVSGLGSLVQFPRSTAAVLECA